MRMFVDYFLLLLRLKPVGLMAEASYGEIRRIFKISPGMCHLINGDEASCGELRRDKLQGCYKAAGDAG